MTREVLILEYLGIWAKSSDRARSISVSMRSDDELKATAGGISDLMGSGVKIHGFTGSLIPLLF